MYLIPYYLPSYTEWKGGGHYIYTVSVKRSLWHVEYYKK